MARLCSHRSVTPEGRSPRPCTQRRVVAVGALGGGVAAAGTRGVTGALGSRKSSHFLCFSLSVLCPSPLGTPGLAEGSADPSLPRAALQPAFSGGLGMIRAGLEVDGPTHHAQTAALAPPRSTSPWDGERGCCPGGTSLPLKGLSVLEGAGSQLAGAEELIQGESFPYSPRLKH